MSDDIEDSGPNAAGAPTKKKGKKKLVILLAALIVLGGGTGGGLYAAGIIGGGETHAADDGKPKLVPKSGQKRGGGDGEGEGEHGGGGGGGPRASTGGEKYASNYLKLDKDFTSNLRDSDRFIQVGVALSTHYDDTVIENIKTNDLAVRSAILMALGDTSEEDIADAAGKEKLAGRLVKAVNATLMQKEGFGGVGNVYFTNFVVQ